MVKRATDMPVGAHYGVRDWISQRVTAAVITLYTVLWLLIVLWNGGVDYATWTSLFGGGAFRIATLVFAAAVLVHAWVGMRNVLMDYVKPVGIRLTLEAVVVCVLVGYAGWTVQVLWAR